MSKSRIFLYILLSFIGGVAVGSFINTPPFFIWVGCLVGIIIILRNLFVRSLTEIVFGFLIIVFFLGILRVDLVEKYEPNLDNFYGRHLNFKGIVWEEPEEKEKTIRIKVKITETENISLDHPFFVLVTERHYPSYELGDELKMGGVLKSPENYNNFDYIAYLARQDIFAVIDYPFIEKIGERKIGAIENYLNYFKKSFEENIDQSLPEPHAAFLKGLLLGERSSLPADLVENFKLSGTSHIVALSGYNITMVSRFFIVLLTFLLAPFYISFWIAVAGLVLFVIMVGAHASVVRAAIMGILILLAQKEGRLYNITNALVLAGAVMIFQNPRILRFDTSFQLSFLAAAGLVYLGPMVENWLNRGADLIKNKFLGNPPESRGLKTKPKINQGFSLKRTLVETLSAQLMVLPLLIYVFGRVSLVSPLANILVLVAVPWSMILGFIMGVAGFISSSLSMILGWMVWVLLEYIILIIEFFAKIPLASVELAGWTAILVIIIYVWFGWKYIIKNHVGKHSLKT